MYTSCQIQILYMVQLSTTVVRTTMPFTLHHMTMSAAVLDGKLLPGYGERPPLSQCFLKKSPGLLVYVHEIVCRHCMNERIKLVFPALHNFVSMYIIVNLLLQVCDWPCACINSTASTVNGQFPLNSGLEILFPYSSRGANMVVLYSSLYCKRRKWLSSVVLRCRGSRNCQKVEHQPECQPLIQSCTGMLQLQLPVSWVVSRTICRDDGWTRGTAREQAVRIRTRETPISESCVFAQTLPQTCSQVSFHFRTFL